MIYSDFIRLRASEREDLPRFVAWLNDPEVRANISLFLPLSLVEEERWFDNMLQQPQPEHVLVIEIQGAEGWKPIGNCGFINMDWRCRFGEVGIFIGEKSVWNQGYGTQVMRLLLRHGFKTLNLNRIYLRVFETNPRAIHVYERVGFVHEGRFRQAEYREGRYIDVLFMSVLRSEWEE